MADSPAEGAAAPAPPDAAAGTTTAVRTTDPKNTGLFDGMEYDHRMVPLPENVVELGIETYLQEGFWPQWTNVFADFGVSVAYFIDGDALLAHCMEDTMVDWEHGGQPLHVIYLVHRFLNLLQQRHANSFSLLFFEESRSCWKGGKAVIRAALIKYLEIVCPEIHVYPNFTSIRDPDFTTLTKLQQPAYLISKREFADSPDVDPRLADGCHAFMLESLNANQSVVLLDRHTVFAGPRLHSWCLLERTADDASKTLIEAAIQTMSAGAAAAPAPQPKDLSVDDLPPRLAAAAVVVKAVTATLGSDDPVIVDLCKAFVVHAALLDRFAPKWRSSVLPAALPSTPHLNRLQDFFDAAYGPLCSFLTGEVSSDGVVADLWDGRFFTRLIIASSASATVGLPAEVATLSLKALKAGGLDHPLEPLCRNVAAEHAETCAKVMTEATESAANATAAADAAVGMIPRYPSSWLNEVCPGLCDKYRRFDGLAAGPAADVAAPAEVVAAEAAAMPDATPETASDDEDDVADNWDDDDSEAEMDAEEEEAVGADAAAAPAPDAAANEAPAERDIPRGAIPAPDADNVALLPPPVEPWLNINAAPEERDAYQSALLSKHIEDDRDRVRSLLKRFVRMLRKKQRNRIAGYEVEQFFHTMIDEMRAMVRARGPDEDKLELDCANDLTTEFNKNKFLSMTKLVIRRWLPRFVATKANMKRKTQLMRFAESLQSRIIKQDKIIESSEEAAGGDTQTVKSAITAATIAVERALERSEARQKDLARVIADVEKYTRKNQFAVAWEALDDLLIERCTADESVYASTERAMDRLLQRTRKKGGGGGKKGQKGPTAKEQVDTLNKQHIEIKDAIRTHNVRVIAGQARLKTTYAWWNRTYLPKVVAARDTGDRVAIVDAEDAEKWAAGKVVAELLQLESLAKKNQMMTQDVMRTIVAMLKQLGFTAAVEAFLKENAPGEDGEAHRAALQRVRALVDRDDQALGDFQMASMGPLLLRPKGQVDPRIERFKPDSWQSQLLDLVDETEKWRRECRKLVDKKSARTWWDASEMVRTRAKDPVQAQSILIHAPTSSGKTFISFYIMEQVLREATNGEGVVVFVAPTKALVNQVEADLYARFDKNYKRESKVRFMHGVFTKEMRRNLHDCQVLITIPECLELLFMMARHGKFVKRLRWVVFDEVHCISKAEGATWERLLVTSPAPFAALSATIGNPNEFGGWLKDLEEAKGRHLNIIEVHQRINDLSLHIYDPRNGIKRQREADRAVRLNPLGILSVPLIKSTGNEVPMHVKLLPEHCSAIAKKCLELCSGIADAEFKKLLKSVDLSEDNTVGGLSMSEASAFEARLKKIVSYLVVNNESIAEALIDHFGREPREIMNLQDARIATDGPFAYLDENILNCLKALGSAGAGSDDQGDLKRLPAIVFHLSVRGCNQLIQRITSSLEVQQRAHQCRKFCRTLNGRVTCEQQALMGVQCDLIDRIRATGYTAEEIAKMDDDNRRKVEAIQSSPTTILMDDVLAFLEHDKNVDWTKVEEDSTAMQCLEKIAIEKKRYYDMIISKCEQVNRERKKEYDSEVEANRDPANLPTAPEYITWDHLMPEYIDPNYSFLVPGQSVTDEELRKHLGRFYDRNDFKTKAFQRGVGVHYPELPRKYKNAVERLFRLRKLQVVIATATLALGINMPCKTVIIAGDEPHFNSLDYHQMIGRAGRRTFDNRGNVVFLGTPSRKIIRLISTPVADLVGNVPLTPALALRLFLRHQQGGDREDKERVIRQTQRIVNNMLFKMGCAGQVQHQLLFCTDFLMGESLELLKFVREKNDVEPSNICSLVALMYYLEPYNFPLVAAMQRGLFEKLLRPFVLGKDASDAEHEENDKKRNVALLTVLAHLVRPRGLPERNREAAAEARLEPLPRDFERFLVAYNDNVLRKYSSYLRKYCGVESRNLPDPDTLPGRQDAGPFNAEQIVDAPVDSAVKMLQESAVPVVTRAPFVALSGHDDTFTSLHDLLTCLREGLYVDRGLVPLLAEVNEPVNSWLVDFYRNGERADLSANNGIPDETLFDAMNDFTHTLRVLRDALKRRLDGDVAADDEVVAAGGDDDDDDPDEVVAVEVERLTAGATDLEVVLHGFTALEASFTAKFKEAFAF